LDRQLDDCLERRWRLDACILIHGPQSDDLTFQTRREIALREFGMLPPVVDDDDA
jgi:hypothetical protein